MDTDAGADGPPPQTKRVGSALPGTPIVQYHVADRRDEDEAEDGWGRRQIWGRVGRPPNPM